MSFRELRNYTEIMKSLGYPRLISMENFRTPNFELVADCIYWLVKRYDPAVELSDDISTETDRVIFLKSVAQIMLTRARIKLNIKRLYSADGLAVKELLKIASMLYQATVRDTDDDGGANAEDMGFNAKTLDVKLTRTLASDITRIGAALYDALEEELELREARMRALAQNMDTDEIERAVKEAISGVNESINQVERMLANLTKDESNLDAKIEKRRSELERSEKRLGTLQSVRPAYMDEYERLQEDLQQLYANYLEKFRNMQYLEHDLDLYRKMEEEKMEESDRHLKKMQKRLRDEELRILRGEAQVDESGIKDEEDDDSDIEVGSPDAKPRAGMPRMRGADARPGAATIKRGSGGLISGGAKGGRVQGNMRGGPDEDSDDLGGISDDGTDDTHVSLNEEGESGDELIGDDDELSDVDDVMDDDPGSSDNEF